MQTLTPNIKEHLSVLIQRYPVLAACKYDIVDSYLLLAECYQNGSKLLIGGNDGSAADVEHIVGELMKGFKKPRCVEA